MTGKKKGLLAQIKNLNNATNVIYTHYIIHREALGTKKIVPELKKVLQEAVPVVNVISSRALNSRFFSKLCKAVGSDHDNSFMWRLDERTSVAKIGGAKRRSEIIFDGKNPTLADLFHNENWLCNLSYLTDIFEKLSELNTSLQGENANILLLHDKITVCRENFNLETKSCKRKH
jgi:hypothetical protein